MHDSMYKNLMSTQWSARARFRTHPECLYFTKWFSKTFGRNFSTVWIFYFKFNTIPPVSTVVKQIEFWNDFLGMLFWKSIAVPQKFIPVWSSLIFRLSTLREKCSKLINITHLSHSQIFIQIFQHVLSRLIRYNLRKNSIYYYNRFFDHW